ncbi:aldehyde dehydrogenase [Mycobacterium saskatchewanense]|uniref:Aldehyde dehydrogenase n=1 Tax=Mycobacterium saskatchewanense TaxID=220927 RepID=A0AAJ3TUR9_9MYCO|nr:aldehyde dehydrogenase [Mycobacterium saskatchewanense]
MAPELVAAAQAETARVVELFEAQRRVHLTSRPPDEAVRRDRLDRLAAALGEHADTIVGAISADFGNRPLAGALAGEVLLQLEEIRTTKRSLRRWMAPFRPQPRYLRFAGIKAWVEPTPLGVVGVISPWNFPVALAIQPTIAAIAAGNTVMIKMSDLAPRAGAAVAEAVAQRFDAEELAVVCGGLEVATAFSALPFDHLFFTGSAAVAKHVQRAAADNLTPLTLELGGKNPTVVATDADLRTAARRIVAARLANSGQVCLSPDYVFVPNPSLAEFVDAAMDAGHRALPTVLDNPDYCTIVNDSHYERICALVQDAHDRGATVREVVPAGESLPSRQARRIPFTLISDVSAGMAVLDEEIFGPVLPVLGYDDVSEVIDFVNARPTPLAAYWFGPDSADFRHFTARTRSGGVTRNDFALHASLQGLPFGGVGSSGTGYYHGKYGFDTFSHMRAFAVSPKHFSPVSLLSPPFDHRLERGLGFVISAWSRRFTKRVNPRRPSQASPEVGP